MVVDSSPVRLSTTYWPTLAAAPRDIAPASFGMLLRAGLVRRGEGGTVALLALGERARIRLEDWLLAALGEPVGTAVQFAAVARAATAPVGVAEAVMAVLGPEFVVARPAEIAMVVRHPLPATGERPRHGLIGAPGRPCVTTLYFDAEMDSAVNRRDGVIAALSAALAGLGLPVAAAEEADGHRGWWGLTPLGGESVLLCGGCGQSFCADSPAAIGDLGATTAGPVGVDSALIDAPVPVVVATPGARTIGEVADQLAIEPTQIVKTMVFVVDGDPVAVLLRGDRSVSVPRLRAALGARSVALADDAVVQASTSAPIGFAGPVGLSIPIFADDELREAGPVVVGANRADAHLTGVWLRRDVKIVRFLAARTLDVLDPCPGCQTSALAARPAVLLARLAWLPDRFAAICGDVAAANGASVVTTAVTMDVVRTLGLIADGCADARGLVWPLGAAPAEVLVLALHPRDEAVMAAANDLYQRLVSAGIDAVFDDRDRSVGAKYADADLVGIPVRFALGKKTVADNGGELTVRGTDIRRSVPLGDAIEAVRQALQSSVATSGFGTAISTASKEPSHEL